MERATILSAFLAISLTAAPASAELIRGGAVLGSVAPIVKISRQGEALDRLAVGDTLYLFTETGEPVAELTIGNVFSDELQTKPLPDTVAREIRAADVVLIYSNLPEYGDFIKAYLAGTSEAFRIFITRFPGSELRAEAQRVVDGIDYRPYKLRGTVEAYEEFMERHPDNAYLPNARLSRDRLVYMPFREADLASGYREFIVSSPQNQFVSEARERIREFQSGYEEFSLKRIAEDAEALVGRKVKFRCQMHSALPVYLEGESVGRKSPGFYSPRDSQDYMNFQVDQGGYVLWRLFVHREQSRLVERVLSLSKGTDIVVYGKVFDARGNAPWIDVADVEGL